MDARLFGISGTDIKKHGVGSLGGWSCIYCLPFSLHNTLFCTMDIYLRHYTLFCNSHKKEDKFFFSGEERQTERRMLRNFILLGVLGEDRIKLLTPVCVEEIA